MASSTASSHWSRGMPRAAASSTGTWSTSRSRDGINVEAISSDEERRCAARRFRGRPCAIPAIWPSGRRAGIPGKRICDRITTPSPHRVSTAVGTSRKTSPPEIACPRHGLDGLRVMHTAVPSSDRDGVEYALRSYLALLAGRAPSSHFLEIRYRVREQQLASDFHPVHDRDALIAKIRDRGSRTDVYVGCAPRVRRSGTKDAVAQIWTLWAECDGDEAANRLRRFRPQPALVVASGSGSNCHAYWPLLAPLAPRRAETANLRLVHALGADRNCF